MSNQLQITGGAKVRNLNGVITGTTGVLGSVPLGAANGVATLDSGGKVPVSQLPSSVVTYLGTWNAATNTPTLVNGTGDPGDLYICNVAGTVNFGAGPISFVVGDWVLYGSGTWQKSSGQNGTVTSVAVTETGDALTITGSPITTAGTINIGFAGTSAQYVAGDGTLITFPSLTGYVPYTGATTDVDLGTHVLNAQALHVKGTAGAGHLGLKHQTATPTGSANESLIFADVNGNLGWQNDNLYLSTFVSNANTANRTYTLQNASGTLAFLSDIPSLTGYVTLATTQTITGAKTFNNNLYIDTNAYWTKMNPIAAISGTMNLYAPLGTSSSFVFLDGDSAKSARFNFDNTANRIYTFPAATGTIALTSDIPSLSNYVTLDTTQTISGQKSFTSLLSANSFTDGYLTITGGTIDRSGSSVELQYAGNGPIRFFGSTLWPILFSSTTGLATFSNSIIASSFIKSGGTSSQFLKADGSVDSNTYLTTSSAASTYLPLSGGTLTGALNGTSASFSGALTVTNNVTIRTTSGYNAYFQTSGTSVRINYLNDALSANVGAAFRATDFSFQDGSGSSVLTIASTGAATFSSSVTAGGNVLVPAGSGIAYSGDANRIITPEDNVAGGLFKVGSGAIIRFMSASNEWMRITGTGNVGIGTSSPNFAATGRTVLDINGTSNSMLCLSVSGTAGSYLYQASGNLNISNEVSGAIISYTGGSERMRITSGGNVLIGTTTDNGTKLNVDGSAFSASFNSSTGVYTRYKYNGTNVGIIGTANQIIGGGSTTAFAIGTESNDYMLFITNNAERLRIASTGAATFSSSVTAGGNINLENNTGLYLKRADGTLGQAFFLGSSNELNIGYGTADVIRFGTYLNTERMRITSGGNVGIGTSSPYKLLTVETATQMLTTGESEVARLVASNQYVGQKNELGFSSYGNNYHANVVLGSVMTSTAGYTQSDFYIATKGATTDIAATERMRITSGGNVGIGTSSPSYKLQVGDLANVSGVKNDIFITGDTVNTEGYYARLIFGNSNQSGGSSASIRGERNGSNYGTALTFYTNETGSAGSGSERMRISSGGRTTITGGTTNSSDYAFVINNSNPTSVLLVRNDGLVTLPYLQSTWTTSNAANVWANPGNGDLYRSTSSIKYKKNVQNYTKGLAEVMQLRPVSYEGKGIIDSGKTFAGLIAEEVHELGLTEFVQYAEDGTPDALAYQNMIALAFKAIQELKAEIDELKNK